MSHPITRLCLTAVCIGVSLAAQARSSVEASADIRRTTYGVPHILAADELGLGYGIGYAYAQDNLCLLANEIVTVNGERARYFGAEGTTIDQLPNLASDVFFNWLNTPQAVGAFWKAQTPEVHQLLEGYAAGYNRLLQERQGAALPDGCQAAWVRPITAQDLIKLSRRLLAEGGVGQFAEALAGAAPPEAVARIEPHDQQFRIAAARMQRFALDRGSNGVAIGRDRSFNGRGMLLANPHFPWVGGMRFYQMHLTIPGKLDVMGAALPGLPVINIGFSRHLAWTHTVDTSRHFTLYRLELDPKDPTRYLLDGKSVAMGKRDVTVQIKQADGSLKPTTRVIYSSVFGPVVQWPGKLDWNRQVAFSIKDANQDNTRVLQQWYAMNRAQSLNAFEDSVHKIQGIPWVNTLAADDQGQTLYMNQSVVPYVDADKLKQCSDPRAGLELIVLDGSRSACGWGVSAQSAQKGIFPANRLPQLRRTDFVQNSNDSAWMVNPAAPLTGYSPIISRDGLPLGPRARFALGRLEELQKTAPIQAQDLQHMVMDDQVYMANQTLPDLLQFCAQGLGADAAALAPVCGHLKAWDRSANLQAGLGFVHFQNIMHALQEHEGVWRVAFDPADPQHTPRGLHIEQSSVAEAVRNAMLASAEDVAKLGLDDNRRWGDIQVFDGGGKSTPIHGGPASLGVYNAIQSVAGEGGKREVVSGSSYLQVVTFDESGPHAQGLLAFSLSSDPASAYSRDQTEAFSRKQWATLPFTEAQIKADAHYQSQVIRESDATVAKTTGLVNDAH